MRAINVVLIALLIATTACVTVGQIGEGGEVVRGSGNVATESREVSGFTKIHLTGGGEIIIEQGDSEGLSIEAEDNFLEYLTSEVSGDTLELSLEEGYTLNPTRTIIYHISVIDLEGIEVDGGATITAEDLTLDTLEIEITGGAMLALSGTANRQTIHVTGGGTYRGADMVTQETEITIDGAGDLTVHAEESLDVTINGAGAVRYSGDPDVTEEINGAGTVTRQG